MVKHIILISIALLIPRLMLGQDLILLAPGGFTNGHINQIDTLDGLIRIGNDYQLIPIQVIVDTIDYPIIGEKTPSYMIKTDKEPILLFKNHNFLTNKINGEFFNYLFLKPDTSIDYKLVDKNFNISVSGNWTNYENYSLVSDYKIGLNWNDKGVKRNYEILTIKSVQIIPSISLIEAPKIIWIGDLDGDDILDLILSESTHYAEFKIGLYLSKNIGENNYPRASVIEGGTD